MSPRARPARTSPSPPATLPWAAASPPARVAAEARVRGAAGDTLVWIDASGPVRVAPIPADDWKASFRGAPQRFLRAEIVAEASREAILDELPPRGGRPPAPRRPQRGRPRPHPVRRAVSNPLYVEA